MIHLNADRLSGLGDLQIRRRAFFPLASAIGVQGGLLLRLGLVGDSDGLGV
jgi:hypothetical protein